MKENLINRKSFYATLLKLALPMLVQNIIVNGVGFADAAMVSRLGQESLAAVSLGAQVFFLAVLAFYGIGSGGLVFFSRFWGSQDLPALRRVFSLCIAVGMIFAVAGMAVSMFYPYEILFAFSKNSRLSQLGESYLFITAFSFPMSLLSIVISYYFRSIHKSHYPMWVSAAALGVDVVLNYLLIFGTFGFPRMGIAGAAWATLLARFFEAAVLFLLFSSNKNPIKAPIKSFILFWKEPNFSAFWRNFLKVLLPVVLIDVIWALSQVAYRLVYARLGTEQTAAAGAYDSSFNLFSVLFIAFGNAAAIIIGQAMGQRRFDLAEAYSKRFLKLNFIVCVPLGLILAFQARNLAALFNLSGVSAGYFIAMVKAAGVCFSFKGLNHLLIIGILRAGGDVRFGFWLETLSLWLLGVPLMFIAAFVVKAPFAIVFGVSLFEEIIRDIIGLLRVKSGRWKKLLTKTA